MKTSLFVGFFLATSMAYSQAKNTQTAANTASPAKAATKTAAKAATPAKAAAKTAAKTATPAKAATKTAAKTATPAETQRNCTDYKQYADISMSKMQGLVKTGNARILDVNSLRSYKRSHIPASHHFKTLMKNGTLKKVLGEDKNVHIVAYCGSKQCTAWQQAARKACEMGYTNIHHFSEGIKGWNKAMKSMDTNTKKKSS